jgi:hypothetical protein
MSDKVETTEKQYSLKPIQSQMIKVYEEQYYAQLSNFYSFLAMEFWGYPVTENTRFRQVDGNVFITEDSGTLPIQEIIEAAPSTQPKDK